MICVNEFVLWNLNGNNVNVRSSKIKKLANMRAARALRQYYSLLHQKLEVAFFNLLGRSLKIFNKIWGSYFSSSGFP